MTWPGAPTFVTTNVDNGTDSPATARGDILNSMLDLINVINGRGQASGVAALDADALIQMAQLRHDIVEITAVGLTNWVIPTHVTSLWAFIAGAGGGGGYTSIGTGGDHGGGGGAGGSGIIRIPLAVPGQTIAIVKGAQGNGAAAGVGDADGTAGGNTTLTYGAIAATAQGGGGGVGGGTRFGGGGGFASGCSVHFQGGAGVSGATRGGAGGMSVLCGPVAGGSSSFGGGGYGSGNGTPGFDGANGGVILFW